MNITNISSISKITGFIIAVIAMALSACIPVYARPRYSPETERLMREAGLMEDPSWEEIDRRQKELVAKKRSDSGSQSIRSGSSSSLHAAISRYGAKYSHDEFHTAPVDTTPNDGYGTGGFDELHINENYRPYVWHPAHRGGRFSGFDEFRYPDEM